MGTSQKQIQANRGNAARSTGPRTGAGKARSRLNAVKHGLLSRHVRVRPDDKRTFGQLRSRMRRQLDPQGILEELLADRIITQSWRLRGVLAMESRISDWDAPAAEAVDPHDKLLDERLSAYLEHYRQERRKAAEREAAGRGAPEGQAAAGENPEGQASQLAAPREATATETVNEAISDFMAVAEGFPDDDDAPEPATGAAVRTILGGSSSAFDVLRRYERGIERGLYLAIGELERMQTRRRDQVAECGMRNAECRQAGSRQRAAGNRQQAIGSRQRAAGSRQRAAGNRQQATGNRQPEAAGSLPSDLSAEAQRAKAEAQRAKGAAREAGRAKKPLRSLRLCGQHAASNSENMRNEPNFSGADECSKHLQNRDLRRPGPRKRPRKAPAQSRAKARKTRAKSRKCAQNGRKAAPRTKPIEARSGSRRGAGPSD